MLNKILFLLLFFPFYSYGAIEDLTTYTETDPGGHLTVTAGTSTIASGNDNNTYNLYKDFGASYFNAIDLDFDIRMNAGNTSDARFGPAFVNTATPSTENLTTFATTDVSSHIYFATTYRLFLDRGAQVASDVNDTLAVNTVYYCTMSRAASSDTITVAIYSDPGRTTLIDTLSVSGFGTGTTYQYFYAFSNAEYNENNTINGYVRNLDLNLAVAGVAQTTRATIISD